MKKLSVALFTVIITLVFAFCLSGCQYYTDRSDKWKTKFDITIPNIDGVGDIPNEAGWYATMNEGFDGDKLNELWGASPHGIRRGEFWCDDMISVFGGNAIVTAAKKDNHICSKEICPKDGYFTSGIQTTKKINDKHVPTFEQAFGYFEARVKFPNSGGMWSAFWLQTDNMKKIGNKGMDGSEIDIYESSFTNNREMVGHCIHYDGYDKNHRGGQATSNTGNDLYEGYHTFALKWTPNEYVFYVDGVATWATDFGGICRVPTYIRLTNEIRPNTVGPYGQKLGDFDGGEFLIDYVKVYQNTNYLDDIKSPDDFD